MQDKKRALSIYGYWRLQRLTPGRFRVLHTYKRKTAANTLDFLERLLEQFPYPIQRIQTDRGREFFAYLFQEKLMEYSIKFRPIKPRSPHLNGKVERSHQTDLQEFYQTADLKDPQLNDRLEEWQFYYNRFGVPVSTFSQFFKWQNTCSGSSRKVSRSTILGRRYC